MHVGLCRCRRLRTQMSDHLSLACHFVEERRKQAVNVMEIRRYLSDFLCPVGGTMDLTRY